MFDISNPRAPRVLDKLELGPESRAHDSPLARDHGLVLTDYFLNEDGFGKHHVGGDHQVGVFLVGENSLRPDPRFNVDFNKSGSGSASAPPRHRRFLSTGRVGILAADGGSSACGPGGASVVDLDGRRSRQTPRLRWSGPPERAVVARCLRCEARCMDLIEQTPPNPEGAAMVAQLALIHQIIRRDLAVISELADEVATASPQTIQDRAASLAARSPIWSLRANCLHYCSFLRGHHLHEDDDLFPRLRRVNPALNPAIQRLKREHETVAKLLERIEQHARAITEQPSARRALSAELTELVGYLLAHLDWEEDTIFPTIRRMAIVSQTVAIDRRTSR